MRLSFARRACRIGVTEKHRALYDGGFVNRTEYQVHVRLFAEVTNINVSITVNVTPVVLA